MSMETGPPKKMVLRISGAAFADPDAVSLRELRDVVADRKRTFPRSRAMMLLVQSDFPNKHRDFEAVLENDAESNEMRHLAALCLGRINSPAATAILIRNSTQHDESVRAGVFRALGAIGNEAALDVVLKGRDASTGQAFSEATFAAALIAHRLGVPGHELAAPRDHEYLELPSGSARRLEIAQASDSDAEFCLRTIADYPLGIEFAERPMYQLRCGRTLWMILLNRDCVRASTINELQTKKALLGAVAKMDQTSQRYGFALVLLAAPEPDRRAITILACRSNGDVVFGGEGRVNGEHVDFRIRAVSRPGAFAVRIEGSLGDGKVRFQEALGTPFAQIKGRSPIEERPAVKPPISST